jgi:hypothetical protein
MIVGRRINGECGPELIIHDGVKDEGSRARKILPKGARVDQTIDKEPRVPLYVAAAVPQPRKQLSSHAMSSAATSNTHAKGSKQHPAQKSPTEKAHKPILAKYQQPPQKLKANIVDEVSRVDTNRSARAVKWLKEEQEKTAIAQKELLLRKSKAQEVELQIEQRRKLEEAERINRDLQLLMASSFEGLFRDDMLPNMNVPQPTAVPKHPFTDRAVSIPRRLEPGSFDMNQYGKESFSEPKCERVVRKGKTDTGLPARTTLSQSRPVATKLPGGTRLTASDYVPSPGVPIQKRVRTPSCADDSENFDSPLTQSTAKVAASHLHDDDEYSNDAFDQPPPSFVHQTFSPSTQPLRDDESAAKSTLNVLDAHLQREKDQRREEGKKYLQDKFRELKRKSQMEKVEQEKLKREREVQLERVNQESRKLATAKLPESAKCMLRTGRRSAAETENIPVYGSHFIGSLFPPLWLLCL